MLTIDYLQKIEQTNKQTAQQQDYIYLAFDSTFSTIKEVASCQSDLNKKILKRSEHLAEALWIGRIAIDDGHQVFKEWRKGAAKRDLIAVKPVSWR
ncbi:hypothetical protein ACEF14_04190 [Weissella paramesenteroides]